MEYSSCCLHLNPYIKILIIAVKLILRLLKKIPCGISVPYGTEAPELCRAPLCVSTTLIYYAQPTAWHASQSPFCLLPCWGLPEQCSGLSQQPGSAGGLPLLGKWLEAAEVAHPHLPVYF